MFQPLTWTTVSGAQAYYLYVGTGVGLKDLVDSHEIQATSYAVSSLPGNQTVYVRLWTELANSWRYVDSTFTTQPLVPTFISPTAGASGVNLSTAVQWTSVPNAEAYYLYVGTTSGATNVVNSSETPATSWIAYDAPTGQTLYARIWAKVGGTWRFNEITFTAGSAPPSRAALINPSAGASNVNLTQALTWTSVLGAQAYTLWIGTSAGTSGLFNTYETQATSHAGVYTLPPNQTLYARLWTKTQNQWRYTDSTFTAAPLPVPTITATVSPAPNAAGWNNTSVTITYVCTGGVAPVNCPPPDTRQSEGAPQTVTRTVIDAASQQSSTSVVVKIDKSAPIVTLAATPATTTGTTLTIGAQISDSLAGVTAVTCNGVAASLSGSTVQCTFAVRAGTNTLVVRATDAAGNSVSGSTTVRHVTSGTPASFMVTPARQTLAIGQTHTLRAVTEDGVAESGVTWSSSNAGVASITTDTIPTLLAVGSGEAVVTATLGSVSAEVQITVSSATLAPGAVVWSVAPTPTLVMQPPIYANRVDPDGPDMFTVEVDADGQSTTVRGLRADGVQLSTEVVMGTPLFGDIFGGLVATTDHDPDFYLPTTLSRFGGSATAPIWRYESDDLLLSPTSLTANLGTGVAQAADGTIYLVELPRDYSQYFLVALDGASGRRKFRRALPLSSNTTSGNCPEGGPVGLNGLHTGGGDFPSSPVVGADGTVYLLQHEWHGAQEWFCTPPTPFWPNPQPQLSSQSWESIVQLLTLDPSVTLTLQEIFRSSDPGPGPSPEYVAGIPVAVTPDGQGGALVVWNKVHQVTGEPLTVDSLITHVDGQTTVNRVLRQLPAEEFWSAPSPISAVGDGTVFLQYGGVFEAVDLSLATKWTDTDAKAIAATDDGGVAVQSGAGLLTLRDAQGLTVDSASLPMAALALVDTDGLWRGIQASGSLDARVGPTFTPAPFSFVEPTGNIQGAAAPPTPLIAHFIPDDIGDPATPFTAQQYKEFVIDQTNGKLRAIPAFSINAEATETRFLDALRDRRNSAVTFVGHSIEYAVVGSVGLKLSDKGIVKSVDPQVYQDPRGQSYTDAVPIIPTSVKVVFVASCETADTFKTLWDITATTKGRSLIIPRAKVITPVDLFEGAMAWVVIANSLTNSGTADHPARGKSVFDAVADGNKWLEERPSFLRFDVIGGNGGRDVRIR
jgi:hypothetical protein